MRRFESASEDDTSGVGRNFASELRAGDVVLISGPLGAGKTAFVRGLAEGLGCNGADVSSPTFTILQQYAGRCPLYHADLYRITPPEAGDLGLDEIAVDGVLAVEWPDRWREAPAGAVTVAIDDGGGDERTIAIERG